MLRMLKTSIKNSKFSHYSAGQAAVEYMLLLGVVVAIVLVGFKTYLPRALEASNVYYNKTAVGILGQTTPCGDGICDVFLESPDTCCADCRIGGCGAWQGRID